MTDLRQHYRKISLHNFRGFKKVENIPLAPLTFLVGPNNSGKSSIFDAILLIAQSGFEPNNYFTLQPSWGGQLVDLGSYEDTVYGHNSNLKIEIGLEVFQEFLSKVRKPSSKSGLKKNLFRVDFSLRTSKGDPIGRLYMQKLTDPLTGENILLNYKGDHLRIEISDKVIKIKNIEIIKKPVFRYSQSGISFFTSRQIDSLIKQSKRLTNRQKTGLRRLKKICHHMIYCRQLRHHKGLVLVVQAQNVGIQLLI